LLGHLAKNIYKETVELSDSIDQMDLIVTYRIFYQTVAEYTLFSAARVTFSQNRSYLLNIRKVKNLLALCQIIME
jgi:hypothetical protein